MEMMGLGIGIIAISVDSFFASLSYSMLGIKIPQSVKVIISLFAGAFIYISYVLAGAIESTAILSIISAFLFITLGYSKIFGFDLVKAKNIDKDSDNTISFNEGVFLALCLSIDAIAIGIYAHTVENNIIFPVLSAIIINYILLMAGMLIGRKMCNIKEKTASLMSGFILLMLAVYNLSF
jgi:putative Mn2+ efflux pump MntP